MYKKKATCKKTQRKKLVKARNDENKKNRIKAERIWRGNICEEEVYDYIMSAMNEVMATTIILYAI